MTRLATMTGVQKCGNSWLYRMIRALDGAGDFETSMTRIRLHWINNIAIALRSSGARRISSQVILQRLFDSAQNDSLQLSPQLRQVLSTSLLELARKVRIEIARAGIACSDTPESIRDRLLEHLLTDAVLPAVPMESYVVSAKHMPLDTLTRAFPSLPIIWLIRDPRDTLLSFFYHDLMHMDRTKLSWFVGDDMGQNEVLTLRDNWQSAFVAARTRTLTQFYERSIEAYNKSENRERILVIRYEDVCADPSGELIRIASFLDWNLDLSAMKRIVEQFSMRSLKKMSSRSERASFVRRGTPGEGRSQMSRSFASDFAPGFDEVVHQLEYESDANWVEHLPDETDLRLDPSRFSPRNSLVYAFDHLWAESQELQMRYPLPHDTDAEYSFHDWLLQQTSPDIQSFLAKSRVIHDAFGIVDVDRNGFEGLMRF